MPAAPSGLACPRSARGTPWAIRGRCRARRPRASGAHTPRSTPTTRRTTSPMTRAAVRCSTSARSASGRRAAQAGFPRCSSDRGCTPGRACRGWTAHTSSERPWCCCRGPGTARRRSATGGQAATAPDRPRPPARPLDAARAAGRHQPAAVAGGAGRAGDAATRGLYDPRAGSPQAASTGRKEGRCSRRQARRPAPAGGAWPPAAAWKRSGTR